MPKIVEGALIVVLEDVALFAMLIPEVLLTGGVAAADEGPDTTGNGDGVGGSGTGVTAAAVGVGAGTGVIGVPLFPTMIGFGIGGGIYK